MSGRGDPILATPADHSRRTERQYAAVSHTQQCWRAQSRVSPRARALLAHSSWLRGRRLSSVRSKPGCPPLRAHRCAFTHNKAIGRCEGRVLYFEPLAVRLRRGKLDTISLCSRCCAAFAPLA